MDPKNKTVLGTGGAGLIGSHLCRRLLASGCFVICLDDLSTGREENIGDLKREPGFRFVRGSVLDEIRFPCDEIYNLACPASPVH